MNPSVDIIIPTYNRRRFISEAIDSVLSQTYDNINCIVVDDGSNDFTYEYLLEKYGEEIRLFKQSNIGQINTLNKYWLDSHAKYLSYLSSDDFLYKESVEKLVYILEKHADIVCAYPNCDLVDSRSTILRKGVCRQYNLTQSIILQECYIGTGAIFRNESYRLVGGWDDKYSLLSDLDFWVRLSNSGKLYMLNESLAAYRTHIDSGINKVNHAKIIREYKEFIEQQIISQSDNSLFGRKNEAFANAYVAASRNCLRAKKYSLGWRYYMHACSFYPDYYKPRWIFRIIKFAFGPFLYRTIGSLKRLI